MHPNPNPAPSTTASRGSPHPGQSNLNPISRLPGRHFIAQRRLLGRKKSTLEDYESSLRVHLVPFFGERPLGEIDVAMVEAFIYAKTRRRQGAEVDPQLPWALALDPRLRGQARLVREQPGRSRRDTAGAPRSRYPFPDPCRARGCSRRQPRLRSGESTGLSSSRQR